MAHHLKISDQRPFNLLVGVGGIGTGMFFALEGDHTLGRNESRPAKLLDIRDYCKLHIIAHYIAVMLGANPYGKPFHVVPIGKVGDDAQGKRLLDEMLSAGMDTRFVDTVGNKPTMLSVCFQYPDGSGGNITTSESAASLLSESDIDRAAPFLKKSGKRAIALAAPEIPLSLRRHLLEIASEYGALRVASFTSAEMKESLDTGLFKLVDLLAINEDEGAAVAGQPFDPASPDGFLAKLSSTMRSFNKDMLIVMSAGKEGAFTFDGSWTHVPSHKVEVASTAGAGDALLGGTVSAFASGLSLTDSLRFGILLAVFSVTSPHTIHPDANLDTLLKFAEAHKINVSDELRSRVF